MADSLIKRELVFLDLPPRELVELCVDAPVDVLELRLDLSTLPESLVDGLAPAEQRAEFGFVGAVTELHLTGDRARLTDLQSAERTAVSRGAGAPPLRYLQRRPSLSLRYLHGGALVSTVKLSLRPTCWKLLSS
ncbi:hypothetical protein J6590_030761 [Homalodisca vitripennis]|nr:hypothetical protein J6590_030761 [Homalodisca vitripennis]